MVNKLLLGIFFTLIGIAYFLLTYKVIDILIPTLITFHHLFSLLEIVFYKGLISAIIAFFFTIEFVLLALNKPTVKNIIIISAFIALSFNITFLIVFPVTIDRSVTTYLLEQIEQKPNITEDELTKIFIDDYVTKRNAINRRMEEQIKSGNVIKHPDGSITLSDQGRTFMSFSRLIRMIFNLPDRRLDEHKK